MNLRSRLAARAAAGTTTLALAATGVAALPAAEAAPGVTARGTAVASRLVDTEYGYQGTAYGTRVQSQVVGLDSTRSAFSYISCTRLAGIEDTRTLADVSLPAGDDPYVHVQAVDSVSKTFRAPKKGVAGGIRTMNTIGAVQLGNSSTPRLSIEGLQTISKAWATNEGKFRTDNKVKAVELSLVNLPSEIPPELQGPLDDLLGAINDGIAQVLQALIDNGGTIVIPGLGEVSVGAFDRQVRKPRFAAASSFVLRVLLYGPDTAKGGADDTLVGIGRSWARIERDVPDALMHGVGFGLSAEVLDGIAKVGRVGEQALPCTGTDGKELRQSTAALNLQGQAAVSGVYGKAFGKPRDDGSARAYTEGGVAEITLGPLTIKGIVGRVNLAQNRAGRIVTQNLKGSAIGEVIVDGESREGFTPAEAKDVPPLEIPGLGSVEFFKKTKSKRGLKVSAVVITLAPGTPALTQVRLGNAQAMLKRY